MKPDQVNEDSIAESERRLMTGEGLGQAILRPVFAATVLLLGYFLLPMGRDDDLHILGLVIGAGLLLGFVYWEFRRFLRDDDPVPSALEVLTAFLGLYVVAFSSLYFLLSEYQPGSFNEKLTRVDALYFCLTVLSTTGFGDLSPESQGARIAVSVQMVTTLVLIGLSARFVAILLQARVAVGRDHRIKELSERIRESVEDRSAPHQSEREIPVAAPEPEDPPGR